MKKVFYEKIGRRYIPVSEYNQDLMGALPKGTHMIMCYPGGQSTHYKIDPAYAPMIAAGRVATDVIASAIVKASDLRTRTKPLTEEQIEAWKYLVKVLGPEANTLEWPSAREAAENAVKAMTEEAQKLLTVPAVKKAYEHFLLVCELTKETKHESSS